MNLALFTIAIAFAVSFAVTPAARRLALRYKVVARPGGRHVHTQVTPLWGGISIYLGFIAAVTLAVFLFPGLKFDTQFFAVIAASTFIAIFGMLDDKYDFSPLIQIGAIVIAALILVKAGIKIEYITNRLESNEILSLGALSIPITVVWIFGVTKTIDLIDGLDGLASGVCAIASTTLILMALQARVLQPHLAESFTLVILLCSALVGGCLGFLRFNFHPAKIFMGTIGAQFMGFILAAASIIGAFKMAALFAIAVPVLALGVPIFDAMFVVYKRFASKSPIAKADTGHVHHRLIKRGLSQYQAVLLIYGMTFAFSVAALIIFKLSTAR